jgi:hypothetical protein
MINPMITLNEIRTFAENNNAAEFDRWCDINGIPNEWLDVTLTDFNDGYYNVDLFVHGVNVMYYDGKLEEFNESNPFLKKVKVLANISHKRK